MALLPRKKGLAVFAANFEPKVAAPLDARTVVSTKADLYLPATWTSVDGSNYIFIGITVSVIEDSLPSNNGLYHLLAADFTQASSWTKIGSLESAPNMDFGTF